VDENDESDDNGLSNNSVEPLGRVASYRHGCGLFGVKAQEKYFVGALRDNDKGRRKVLRVHGGNEGKGPGDFCAVRWDGSRGQRAGGGP
jgi:hypothetical protein